MTGYALSTMVLRNEMSDSKTFSLKTTDFPAIPVVRWLVHKRNAYGGWSSTQDTVVALQALASWAQKSYSPGSEATIEMTNGNDKRSFSVNQANSLVGQEKHLH